MITVPFVDLHCQYQKMKSEIDAAIQHTITNSEFVRGKCVEQFEQKFAEIIGTSFCVSCGNGTDALYIAMKCLGISAGDQVITTAHSWISTSEAITQAGGQVIFCDTELDTFNIDPNLIEQKITPQTVGIVPVHLYGLPVDMDKIMSIARKHNLWVVEDCAQAHLARFKNNIVGTFGDAATFSFYPSKNLGAMGDAGAILTNNSQLAEKMTMFARHGGLKKGEHKIEGMNSRLDGMQASILLAKLKYLSDWTTARQDRAQIYDRALLAIPGLSAPTSYQDYEHVYHIYAIRHDKRNKLQNMLKNLGIQTQVNYPRALPFLPAYHRLKHKQKDFPNAWHNQSRVLSLPLYPELDFNKQKQVIDALIKSCKELESEEN